jgi:hypothetical protein
MLIYVAGPRGIEPLPSVSKTEMISISPRTDINNYMNMYCVESSIDLPFLKDNSLLRIKFPNYHVKLSTSLFEHDDFIKYLASKDLRIMHCSLFYAKPHLRVGIHTDNGLGDFAKLNVVFGGADSVMNWYEPKTLEEKITSTSEIGTQYQHYSPEEVNLVHSQQLKERPTIVQVGVPHNMKNSTEPRHCFSCVLGFIADESFTPLTMDQAINLLS